MLQIRSAEKPFDSPGLHQQALETLKRADAMGLLPQDKMIEKLNIQTLRQVLTCLAKAGIGRGFSRDLGAPSAWEAPRLEKFLARLNEALEESPAPKFEWPRLIEVLGFDQLARLLNVSASSVRRYKDQDRPTPDDVAARLHFLALVVGDLAGAYNDVGIRRWFERPRTALNNRSPAQLLTGEWNPSESGPSKVRDLARSLVTAAAT
jgi:uncharacterized protein (DUF2384 family)